MNLLNIAIIIFVILETGNIALLYFAPGSRMGNAMGAFRAFAAVESGDANVPADTRRMVSYLVNWVAGTKLIFIALLLVILFTASDKVKLWSLIVMIPSIATYFWRLHSIVRKGDAEGEIIPAGYSRTLGLMIAGFLVIFTAAVVVTLATGSIA